MNKHTHFIKLLLVVFPFLFVMACKRDKIIERRSPTEAVFTFGSNTGDCINAIATGEFRRTKALTNANRVTIDVNVTKIGIYSISSDTVNGYSFAGSGSFTATGVQKVTIVGKGTPLSGGIDDFFLRSGNIVACSFSIPVIDVVAGPAVFTLGGAPNACTGAATAGTYALNVPLTSSNTATIEVNVTSIGAYSISTNTVSGISFSSTGIFTTTGVQNVVLTGSGTPTASGDLVLKPKVGTAECSFTVKVAGPATYTMAGAPGNCTGAAVAGTYAVGVPLAAANTATVQVNVTTAGSYTLATNTVSGISFSASGIFTTTGVQNVVLKGSGTPTASGAQVLKPKIGTSECSFTVTVAGAAAFTYAGGTGNCTGTSVSGTYTQGTALTAGNTVSIQVNVTAIGGYTISTNTVSGIKFSKSGNFTATGVQTVVLNGSGTPSASGNTVFAITSGCSFSVNIASAPVTAAIYKCKIDGVLFTFTDRAKARTLDDFFTPPVPYLDLDGYSGPPTGGNVPQFTIVIEKNDNSPVGPGTYDEKNLISVNGYNIAISYSRVNSDLSVTLWGTSSNFSSPNPPFTIIVTSVSNGRVKGTFSGKLTNLFQGSTTTLNITEGEFDLPIDNS